MGCHSTRHHAPQAALWKGPRLLHSSSEKKQHGYSDKHWPAADRQTTLNPPLSSPHVAAIGTTAQADGIADTHHSSSGIGAPLRMHYRPIATMHQYRNPANRSRKMHHPTTSSQHLDIASTVLKRNRRPQSHFLSSQAKVVRAEGLEPSLPMANGFSYQLRFCRPRQIRRVCGLDYPFTLASSALGAARLVSTPSLPRSEETGLGSGLPQREVSPNLSSSTSSVSRKGTQFPSSPLRLPIPPRPRRYSTIHSVHHKPRQAKTHTLSEDQLRKNTSPAEKIWRLGSESNRRPRLCRPLHNHSATQPEGLTRQRGTHHP